MADQRPYALICYVDDNIQKWVVVTKENEIEILTELWNNTNVVKESIFIIPANSLMLSCLWFYGHDNSKFDFNNFFKEFGQKQNNITISPKAKKIAKNITETINDKNDKSYGFISPDGQFYPCKFEEHYYIANNICFYRFGLSINNPERYLEEKGWLKIFRPFSYDDGKYGVYIGDKYVINDAQYKTLCELKLENAYGVKDLLVPRD